MLLPMNGQTPHVQHVEYQHEAMLYYATPQNGFRNCNIVPLDTNDPAEVNARVRSTTARSRLAFFHITRQAIATVDHGNVADVLNMDNVHYGVADGFERVYGKRLMTAAHFVIGETNHTFDLKSEGEIVKSKEVPERVRAWLTTWREGNYMGNLFPDIQKLL